MSLMTQDDFSRQLAELDKIQETCRKLIQTKHYQKFGEEGLHAIMARAKSLRIDPFLALNSGFYVVAGRVGMYTEMMAALARQKGHSITKDIKSNKECVILHGKRCDNGDTWTCSFTKSDAEAAGLWNTATWKKYSETMLYNRAMSMLFRQLFADISLGAGYCPDEIDEITRNGDYQKNLKDLPFAECDVSNEPEKPLITNKISKEHLEDITNILDECPKEYMDKVKERLKSLNMKDYSDMTPEMYNAILPIATKKREELIKEQLKLEDEENASN